MPGQLVRYRRAIVAAPRAAKFKYVPYARYSNPYAYAQMEAAARATSATIKAAKIIGKAGRRWIQKRRKRQRIAGRSRIGQKIGSTNSKRTETLLSGSSSLSTNTLYTTVLSYPSKDTNAIHNRDRNVINLTGFKICIEISSKFLDANQPGLYCNVALVTQRENPGSQTFNSDHFFRNTTNSSTRDRSFATTTKSLDFRCLPINPERYNILMHKRLFLGAKDDGRISGHRLIEQWMPIRRQISFDADNVASCYFFVLKWFTLPNTDTATPTTSVVDVQQRIVTYFRDPKTT